MKTLKIIGLLFFIVGVACIGAAFIWNAVEPDEWGVLGPMLVGIFLLAIVLLGLIVFLIYRVYRVISKGRRLRG